MAVQLQEQRIISGKGLLKVPDTATKSRYFLLYADIVRYPKNEYRNLNYNPYRSRYATLLFLRGGYVIQEAAMEYSKQQWSLIPDLSGQTLIAVKCAYEGTLISFANLATGLGLPIIQYTDLIKDYENLSLGWDTAQVVCYADTVIRLSLYGDFYASCSIEKDKQQKGGNPPPPPPSVPPGTPITDTSTVKLSKPYDYPNDGGNTVPYPSDQTPPQFDQCSTVTVVFTYTRVLDGVTSQQTFSVQGKAPVVSADISEIIDGGSSIFLTDAAGPNNTCVPNTRRRVNRGLGTWSNLSYTVSSP